ncbi:MAG: IS1634 family transposase [Candidatus Marinimicrobia bacterium]|nr:IS1634 family transposase [Candidatus Neomarinimicrobiota bacterium]
MARFRTTSTGSNTYLQYVKSYRNKKGLPATRVIASLGNISNMSEDEIGKLTKSFIRVLGVGAKFQINNFTAGKAYHYGTCLPAIALWHQLGLDRIINEALPSRVKIPVSHISLIQVANRFSDPGSKLACYRWYERSMFSQLKNFVHFPDTEDERLHYYYRSLDYLCSIKHEIERSLYHRLNSYGLDNSLILYDITSVYFEGDAVSIAEKGHTRIRQPPDAEQIVIGLVMSRDGIPIAHHLFEGNRVDKSTVAEVIEDLQDRFSIKDIVFVGDRGMMTVDNIESVKRSGNNYIMGLQKRNRRIVEYLMPLVRQACLRLPVRIRTQTGACLSENARRQADTHRQAGQSSRIQEFSYEDLSEELKREYSEKVRFIACYNKDVAKANSYTRERNIANFEQLVESIELEGKLSDIKDTHHSLKSFLSKYHMTKFYKISLEKIEAKDHEGEEEKYTLRVVKNNSAIEYEESIDGRYFIQTEVEASKLSKELVESSYKSLQKVERAFSVLKNEFDIRPVFVRRESRIRGHVMICYLSLLIEVLIEKKLKEIYPEIEDSEHRKKIIKKSRRNGNEALTITTLMEELDTVRLVPFYVDKSKSPGYISTMIENNVKKLLSSLGIRNANHPCLSGSRRTQTGG